MLLDRLNKFGDQLDQTVWSLATARKASGEIRQLVGDLTAARQAMSPDELEAVDPYLVVALDRGLLAAWQAFGEDVPEQERRALRLALEQIRQALRDLREEEPISESRTAKQVARWLDEVLDAPQPAIAELLGVSPRQYQRWVSQADPAEPRGGDATRLRVLARLVAHLRHAWTGPGVLMWLRSPHPALDGERPATLLRDTRDIPRLRRLASSARSARAA